MTDVSVSYIKQKIDDYHKKADNDKTLNEALNICDSIDGTDFSNIMTKYDKVKDLLVKVRDYKDESSGKYKFSRILETYLAKKEIFKDIKNFGHNRNIFILYNSREGVLPWEGCFIYKKFKFNLDDKKENYIGLKDNSDVEASDISNLKTLLSLISNNVDKEIKITNTNKELNMYFVEKTTKVRLDDSNNPITNIYSLAKVEKDSSDKLVLKYYKAVMKDEATKTIEIKLEDANIP